MSTLGRSIMHKRYASTLALFGIGAVLLSWVADVVRSALQPIGG